MINLIKNMHSYCRPSGSITEQKFIERYIETIPNIKKDSFGNYFIRIGTDPVIFTAHTDTVHDKPGYQGVKMIGDNLMLRDTSDKGSCLGADCAAGVFLILKMIEAKKEGLFCLFRAEEIGGLGSDHFVKNYPLLLKDYKFVISLDRKGTNSVITHQGSRTCSDIFADSLCQELGSNWIKDSSGLFTDSRNFADDAVGECSNISTGYTLAHSRFETLDVRHLLELLDLLLGLDVSKLISDRKPGEKDYADYLGWDYSGSKIYNPYGQKSNLFPLDNNEPETYKANSYTDLISVYPDVAERELRSYGLTLSDFQTCIYNQTGELAAGYIED